MAYYGAWCRRGVALFTALMLIAVTAAAPVESEEEVSDNGLGQHTELGSELGLPWDGLDADALRKILIQLEAGERMAYAPRSVRAWTPIQRGWSAGPRSLDSRAVRQWRADKRQVRFRQCYFNPISCFRK